MNIRTNYEKHPRRQQPRAQAASERQLVIRTIAATAFMAVVTIGLLTLVRVQLTGSFAGSSTKPSGSVDKDFRTVRTTDKGPRIGVGRTVELACKGQSWGHESRECIAAISGQTGRRLSRTVGVAY